MKQISILVLFLILSFSGKAQFRDDFSDGNLSSDPVWTGDTASFKVSPAFQLRLDSEGADTGYLVTQSNLVANTKWEIWIKLSFNTSANNFARIYLVSNQENLHVPLNGYFLQIGGPDDSLVFYRQEGNTCTPLFTGKNTCTNHSGNTLRVMITHDKSGRWRLFIDPAGGNSMSEEGSCIDTVLNFTSWFGVYCRYTSSNATKFYFDDILCGEITGDTLAPAVSGVLIRDSTHLELTFSETIDTLAACSAANYETHHHGFPQSVAIESQSKVTLTFSDAFEADFMDTLIVKNISDTTGNLMAASEHLIFRHTPRTYEIIINEIMADPDPPAGLPDCEYVEIYNRGELPADLTGWRLEFGTSVKFFPMVIIPPEGYLTITKGSFLSYYGPSLDMFTSASSLSNEGTVIVLKNADGKIIHTIDYSKEWYHERIKEEGGWSLEMKDENNPCGCSGNWSASLDPSGGTPGRKNSVSSSNPDTIPPVIRGVRIRGDSLISVVFSETMDTLFQGVWTLSGQNLNSVSVAPGFAEIQLFPPEPMIHGIGYTLTWADSLSDCAGNILKEDEIRLAIPDSVNLNDVIFNEILSDPVTGGARFVEIYNRSSKIIDLKDLVFCSFDTTSRSFQDQKIISTESFLFFPGNYLILTNDVEDILSRYNCDPGVFINLSTLPAMSDDYGNLVLSRKHDGLIIDQVVYDETMHFPLLESSSGISLERISSELSTGDKTNWHSASSACGYATPGYPNSQTADTSRTEGGLAIEPPVFSPDNDGKDDLIRISVRKREGLLSLVIYNETGRMVRCLARNRLSGEDECFFWDGMSEEREKLSSGIYLIYLEHIDSDGRIYHEKKPLVLAAGI